MNDVRYLSQRLATAILALAVTFLSLPAFASRGAKPAASHGAKTLASLDSGTLHLNIDADGSYSIFEAARPNAILESDIEAEVDSRVLRSSEYPQHPIAQTTFQDDFGSGPQLTITHTGLAGAPDLRCTFKLYQGQNWGEVEVQVVNTTGKPISIQAIRTVNATRAPVVDLNGPPSSDRVLSDSYSEDRPQLAIRDLADAPGGVHRAVGSQLIYNRKSGESLFLGALTSERLLTIFHLKEQSSAEQVKVLSLDAVATGTTEIMKGESLKESPASQQVELSLRVDPGESLSGERLMFAAGKDYHAQLEQYGKVVGQLHHARVHAATPIGWWSWTAYYFGLNQGTAVTNAEWLAANLKPLGYKYFQADEGYQYARGEYTTADAHLFPRGIAYLAGKVQQQGLTFGLWTAPFEVSERASVFQNHKDWLLHNADGELIRIGYVTDHNDPLYVLDVTNPGAQAYLKQTYTTLYNWGLRFVKMDFMDDSAVEGAYFRPNTTALEAQRVGLKIIRSALGEDFILDKDGSPMLNPVGIVDAGRISQDTGHTFHATKDAASGIAARYYMNRNFYIADPDAFTVSTQTVDDQAWHGGEQPLTMDEAKVSIALAAVSGGMFEIGDDLPTLGASAERLALVKASDLIDMARLGRSSVPLDLMTYQAADEQPSIFLLKESRRQTILAVFNWSDSRQVRTLSLSDLGPGEASNVEITDAFDASDGSNIQSGAIHFIQEPHSVRVLKLINRAVPAVAPDFELRVPASAQAGVTLKFTAETRSDDASPLKCTWDFGDGAGADGLEVSHTYTHEGEYQVQATATGIDGVPARKEMKVSVSGTISTTFVPADKQRPE